MELWIPITIAAAFLQNLRSMMQKHLTGVLSTTGATFTRFAFGIPFALLYCLLLFRGMGYELPRLSNAFYLWIVIAGSAQIAATILLVHLFSLRNFAVGNAYSRTEPMQTAIFAFVLFGVPLSYGAIFAIFIAVTGVMLISVAQTKITPQALVSSLLTKTALIGLSAGTCFGLAAIGFQTATQAVISQDFIVRAASTLFIALLFQSAAMSLYIAMRQPREFKRLLQAWKPALFTGFFGATATFGWFTAFTLQHAALVKVVAQVEILFSFGTAIFFFKEKITSLEAFGCILIGVSILYLILLA